MLPESNESNELRLYECVDFPYKWKLNKIIFDNGKYVDSSIICKGDIYYLFTTHKTENSFYHELYYCNDLLSDKWIKHPQSPISNNPKFARNGGSVFRIITICSVLLKIARYPTGIICRYLM